MKPINVGLLGIGTVGGGTFTVLKRNENEITRRAGRAIRISVVADKDTVLAKKIAGDAARITDDAFSVVNDLEIDIIVVLIGGCGVAKELVLKAIENGKHVVTANKALLATHGTEIFAAAQKKGVMVAFEAAVAGGIPIVKAVREGLSANRIQWIAGIINGTTNFILSEMRDKGLTFAEALKEAQRLGYAETDPTFEALRTRLAAGEIGDPEMLVVTSRDPSAPPISYLKSSGGIFKDMLIHDFDIFRWILDDKAVSISATGSCLSDPGIAEVGDIDSAVVTIRTRRGRLCQINASRRAAYGYDQRFEVLGSKGMLQARNLKPTEVVSSTSHNVSQDKPEHFFLERYRVAYANEMAHFFDALANGKQPQTTIQDGVKALELADAATHSWRERRAVEL